MNDYLSKPVTALALNEMLEESLTSEPSAALISPESDPRHGKPVHIQRIQAIADGDFSFEQDLIEISAQQIGLDRAADYLRAAAQDVDRQLADDAVVGLGLDVGVERLEHRQQGPLLHRRHQPALCQGGDEARGLALLLAASRMVTIGS